MAGRARKPTNVKLARKINPRTKIFGDGVNPLKTLAGVLAFVGKPFYFILSHLVLAAIFILYLIGHVVRTSGTAIIRKVPTFLAKVKLLFLKIKLFATRFKPLPRFRLKPKVILVPIFVISLLFSFYFFILKGLPSPKDLVSREIEVSTKIYDRSGILLYKIYEDENRSIISLKDIPLHVRQATLAAEDAEFYNHPGFSVRGIFRAFFQNLKTGKLQGGSTITQQLVKNALLSSERTLVRKVREVILSIGVELTFTKDQILEMYFNEVPYGGTAYGIEEAAQQYFGKNVGRLNLAEAALIAGLPKSPTKFSPFGPNPDLAFARQKEVLHLMRINKFITGEQESSALNQRITFAPNRIEIKAPHFVMYVRQLLVDSFGEEVVEKGGLEVITTLDYPIQELAEKVVKEEVVKLKGLRVGNGAALILNPATGEILAMVGSKDYFDTASGGQVNVTLRPRQPGSSIKIINYAYALSNGFSAATILDDSPVTFVVPGQPPYSPKNYDGEYRGHLSLRSALAESRNIPAVKVLASYGVAKMIDLGHKLGITTWEDPSQFGLSLTLGGGEVKLIDLAQAYAVVASYGKRPEIRAITEVKNYKGRILEENNNADTVRQVLDPRVAYLLIDILKDNTARVPAFGSSSALVVPNHPEVAVKTGTSNDLKDNLTLGFNQKYLVATWVGNNDNSPMARIASGVTGASPTWNKIMAALLANEPSIDWLIPEGLVKVNCGERGEWFLEEDKNILKYCLPTETQHQPGAGQAPDREDNKEEERQPQIL